MRVGCTRRGGAPFREPARSLIVREWTCRAPKEATILASVSAASATVTRPAFNALALLPFGWLTQTGYEKETETGYEKAVKVAGHPALEKWNSDTKDGELTLIVAKRYIVNLEGNQLPDPKPLHALAESMALGKLPTQ